MSDYKLVDSTELDSDLSDIADAIRAKTGESSPLAFPNDFLSAIQAIPTGGGGLSVTSKIIRLTNNFGSQVGCNRLRWEIVANTTFDPYQSNISNGSTLTESYMAIFTDSGGDFFLFHSTSNLNGFSYNNSPLSFTKTTVSSGQRNYKVYLPVGFDNSYPIIIT